ncbi:hypothetical protein BDP27DRAFT_1364719 [Rhodocollybia butyracea]|uniref:Uncharacterized protein n=1 Tax=Rhodocollybia butyracea TaxID=206335 RepID=A0A9P5PQR0_9AGAR|nr:hypothetical protein BDP27DRAFT_1364719 [Rhodocollybia butyracea]
MSNSSSTCKLVLSLLRCWLCERRCTMITAQDNVSDATSTAKNKKGKARSCTVEDVRGDNNTSPILYIYILVHSVVHVELGDVGLKTKLFPPDWSDDSCSSRFPTSAVCFSSGQSLSSTIKAPDVVHDYTEGDGRAVLIVLQIGWGEAWCQSVSSAAIALEVPEVVMVSIKRVFQIWEAKEKIDY